MLSRAAVVFSAVVLPRAAVVLPRAAVVLATLVYAVVRLAVVRLAVVALRGGGVLGPVAPVLPGHLRTQMNNKY